MCFNDKVKREGVLSQRSSSNRRSKNDKHGIDYTIQVNPEGIHSSTRLGLRCRSSTRTRSRQIQTRLPAIITSSSRRLRLTSRITWRCSRRIGNGEWRRNSVKIIDVRNIHQMNLIQKKKIMMMFGFKFQAYTVVGGFDVQSSHLLEGEQVIQSWQNQHSVGCYSGQQ